MRRSDLIPSERLMTTIELREYRSRHHLEKQRKVPVRSYLCPDCGGWHHTTFATDKPKPENKNNAGVKFVEARPISKKPSKKKKERDLGKESLVNADKVSKFYFKNKKADKQRYKKFKKFD